MSLDVSLYRKLYLSYDEGKTHVEKEECVYDANITHNLGKMAQTDVSSSFLDDIFNIKDEVQEPINMPKDEFVAKTKKLLNYISDQYSKGWQSRRLKDEEYPEESICDKCTGCGTFKLNEEDAECVADREEGECYVRYFDAEEFGLEIEATMDDVYELLFIDNVE